MKQGYTLLISSLLFLSLKPLYAQQAELVKDINQTGDYSNMVHTNLFAWRGSLYYVFLYNHPSAPDLRLMRIDPDNDHPITIYDEPLPSLVYPDLQNTFGNIYYDAKPSTYADSLNNVLIFTFYDPVNGVQLWKTDGTTAGTSMIKQTKSASNGMFYDFTVLGSFLYYVAVDSSSGYNLWRTDGTAAGTKVVYKFSFIPQDVSFAIMNQMIYFAAADNDHGIELWKTDGTAAGTEIVKDINPANSSYPKYLSVFHDSLFFSADDSVHGREIWKTNGTAEGTQLAVNIAWGRTDGGPLGITSFKDALFFFVIDSNLNESLWKSSGNNSSTFQLKDLGRIIRGGTLMGQLFPLNDQMYFVLRDGDISDLWKTDGSSNGTVSVKSISNSEIVSFTSVDSTLYFPIVQTTWDRNYYLWKSNGTPEGTTLASSQLASVINFPTPLDHSLFCAFNLGYKRTQIIRTQGTDATTTFITENTQYTPGAFNNNGSPLYYYGAWSFIYARMGSILYFAAADSVNGEELWRSNGTSAGTYMLKDINPGANANINQVISYHHLLLFNADDGINGNELWVSDGTNGGTHLLKDIAEGNQSSTPSYFTLFKDAVYFVAVSADSTVALWKTDGTDAGTSLVKVLGSGVYFPPFAIEKIDATSDHLFIFVYNNDYVHRSLYSSDGTEAGTFGLGTFDAVHSYEYTAATDDLFYFNTFKGPYAGGMSTGVWSSDGTVAGTLLTTSTPCYNRLVPYNGSVYFLTGYFELHKLNAAEESVINVPSPNAIIDNFNVAAGKLYFFTSSFDPPYGARAWLTDGTQEGTTILTNPIVNGIYNPLYTDHAMYFETGAQPFYPFTTEPVSIWKSDGTPCGTDSLNGTSLSGAYLQELPVDSYNDTMYFISNRSVYGNELWEIKEQSNVVAERAFYADHDGDGYGNRDITVRNCAAPEGYVSDSTDCNDSDAAVHPGAIESLNGIDDNCDGIVDNITGIDPDPGLLSLRIEPNPSRGEFAIRVNHLDGIARVTIHSIAGEEIFSENISANGVEQISLHHAIPGIYILTFSDNKNVMTERIVIQ